jgi:hypothetical protein
MAICSVIGINAFLRRQPDRGFGREDPFCDLSR